MGKLHECLLNAATSFVLYRLLPAGRSHQQSETATNKLIILLERLAGNYYIAI